MADDVLMLCVEGAGFHEKYNLEIRSFFFYNIERFYYLKNKIKSEKVKRFII